MAHQLLFPRPHGEPPIHPLVPCTPDTPPVLSAYPQQRPHSLHPLSTNQDSLCLRPLFIKARLGLVRRLRGQMMGPQALQIGSWPLVHRILRRCGRTLLFETFSSISLEFKWSVKPDCKPPFPLSENHNSDRASFSFLDDAERVTALGYEPTLGDSLFMTLWE